MYLLGIQFLELKETFIYITVHWS